MVKKYWLVVALVAGIAAGVALHAFLFGGTESDEWLARGAQRSRAAEAAAPVQTGPGPARPGPAHSGNRPAAPPAEPSAPQVAFDTRPGEAEAGFVQGNVINAPPDKQLRFEDPLHEEFVREERDDSWAYLREAELENSMVMELSAGNFKKDRIECRTSICEIELSATGEQVELLRKWFDEKNAQRGFSLDEPLMMRGTSFSADGKGAQARILYMKPQRLLPPPKKG